MASAMALVVFALKVLMVTGIQYTLYTKHARCNLRDRINNGCFVAQFQRSRSECAAYCSAKPPCTNFILSTTDSTCYIPSACNYTPPCSVYDPDLKFFTSELDTVTTQEPMETTQAPIETTHGPVETTHGPIETTQAPCANGGVLVDGACQCEHTGRVGNYCETYPVTCTDLQSSGYPDGEYSVFLDINGDGSNLAPGLCKLTGSGVKLDLIRNSGSFNVNHTFAEYVAGYYLGPYDFFAGLDNVVALLDEAEDITCTVHYNSSAIQGTAWVTYQDVELDRRSATQYEFTQSFHIASSGVLITLGATDTTVLKPDEAIIEIEYGSTFTTTESCIAGTGRGWWLDSSFPPCTNNYINPLGLNYQVLPGPTSIRHVQIPGVSNAKLETAFLYFSLSVRET